MERIQVVLDKRLLQAVDRAALRTGQSRSALVRDALREHLQRLDLRALEEREREGYKRRPQDLDEIRLWEGKAVWPGNKSSRSKTSGLRRSTGNLKTTELPRSSKFRSYLTVRGLEG